MKMLKITALVAMLALLNVLLTAQVAAQTSNGSGQVRALLSQQSANPASPQTQASQLRTSHVAESQQLGALEVELHVGIKGINATATVQGQSDGSGNSRSDIWLNELVGAWGQGAWQLSAGSARYDSVPRSA